MAQTQEDRAIIRNAALAAAGVGVPGAFLAGFDTLAVTGVWATMTMALASRSGHALDKTLALKLTAAVAKGAFLYIAGSKAITTFLAWTGIGMAVAVPLNAAFNYIYTVNLGTYLAEQFTMPNVDAERMLVGILANPTWLRELRSTVFQRPSASEVKRVAKDLNRGGTLPSDA